VGRFLREARAACAVRHPNVVPIHDVLQLPSGVPIMVMDLLDGESLGDRLARTGRLSVHELAVIMLPVVSAIQAAHAASVVHRDLKPDNLFLVTTAGGRVDARVLDFGIAKVTTSDEKLDPLTKTGSMVGTPYYMSPEQLFGEKDVDHRTDVWALGIILYECLTGRRPTEADNLGQIIKLVTTTGIPPLDSVVPGIPADLSMLVSAMLTIARDARPALRDVEALLARYAAAPTPASVNVASGQVVISVGASLATAKTSESWAATQPEVARVGRARYVFAAAGVLLTLAGGGLAVQRWRARSTAVAPSVIPAEASASASSAPSLSVRAPTSADDSLPMSASAAMTAPAASTATTPSQGPPPAASAASARSPVVRGAVPSAPPVRSAAPAASSSSPPRPTTASPLEEKAPF
jgi:serine/threonine-protein kinase